MFKGADIIALTHTNSLLCLSSTSRLDLLTLGPGAGFLCLGFNYSHEFIISHCHRYDTASNYCHTQKAISGRVGLEINLAKTKLLRLNSVASNSIVRLSKKPTSFVIWAS